MTNLDTSIPVSELTYNGKKFTLNTPEEDFIDDYTIPSQWLSIPDLTGDTDEIYLLKAILLKSQNTIVFSGKTTSGTATINWGDGTTTESITTTETIFSHTYDYSNISENTYSNDLGYKQVLIHISGNRGDIEAFSLAQDYSYLNEDNNEYLPEDIHRVGSNLLYIKANTEDTTVYCCPVNTNTRIHELLEVFDWTGTINNSSMESFFYNCTNLRKVSLTTNGTLNNIKSFFSGCHSIKEIPLFNTENTTSFESFCQDCYSLKKVPLYITSKVSSFANAFKNCYSLEEIPEFDMLSNTSLSNFATGSGLKSIPQLNTSKVNTTYEAFKQSNLEEFPELDLSLVSNANSMFSECKKLRKINNLNLENCETAQYTFSYGYGPLDGTIQMKNIKDLKRAFSYISGDYSNKTLNIPDCTTLDGTFYGFTGIPPKMILKNATTMSSCFQSAVIYKLPKYNTSKITNMSKLFYDSVIDDEIVLDCSSVINCDDIFTGNKSAKKIILYNLGKSSAESLTLSDLSLCQRMSKQDLIDLFNSLATKPTDSTINYTRNIQLGDILTARLSTVHVKPSTDSSQYYLPTSDIEIDSSKTYYTLNEITGEYSSATPDFSSDTVYFELITSSETKYEICESTADGAVLALDWFQNTKGWTLI